jgi:Flp pilus assembly protein TadG
MKLRFRLNSRHQRGQSLVEFAMVLPVMAVMLSAVLEFGFAMDANMALEAASRQGARVGAVLGNDGTQGVCTGSRLTTAEATVDPAILDTVKASLTSGGIDFTKVKVWIFLADANGQPTVNEINKYSWVAGAWQSSTGDAWRACDRHDGTFAGGIYDDVGVRIQYTYASRTGLLAVFTGGLPMTTSAIMPIGPPWTLLP